MIKQGEQNPGDLDKTHTPAQERDSERVVDLIKAFSDHFGAGPDFVTRAPGRINLIGEHTDYTGGFVLPVAINRTLLMAVRKVQLSGHQIELFSLDLNSQTTLSLDKVEPAPEKDRAWSNYVRGVAWALNENRLLDLSQVSSAQIVLSGDIPRGAGLSSSAALEVASALAFFTLAEFVPREIDRVSLALACQKAENEFVGVKTGIMDQFISALGQTDSALFIDTRSLENRAVPLNFGELKLKLVAVDSAVPHSLRSSAYNQRRTQCEEAASRLAKKLKLLDTTQLRDISLAQLEEAGGALTPTLKKRARHVVSENERVLEAVKYFESGFKEPGSLEALGQLLKQSHESLRDDYEVSVPQLDLLVELAQKQPGVIGSRMTGGGFGGCTVNIVREDALGAFETEVVEEYRRQTGLDAKMYILEGVEGGSVLR